MICAGAIAAFARVVLGVSLFCLWPALGLASESVSLSLVSGPIQEFVSVPAGTIHQVESKLIHFDDVPELMKAAKTLTPDRTVAVNALQVGKYDVTREQYGLFISNSGYRPLPGCLVWREDEWVADDLRSWRSPGFAQTERDPVVCVSWDDAHAYIRWLNSQLSKDDIAHHGRYRLPTLAEAQYFARSGAATDYFWGDTPSRARANYGADDCFPCRPKPRKRGVRRFTSPVGTYPPNDFGIYDATGNVWQLTDDDTLKPGSISDESTTVTFGGSWLDNPERMKLTSSVWGFARTVHTTSTGFRVVRSLHECQERAGVNKTGEPSVASLPADGVCPAGNSVDERASTHQFRDCPGCPVMTALPSGTLKKDLIPGLPADLQVPSFAIGTYDLTRGEYARFIRETGYRPSMGCERLSPAAKWTEDPHLNWKWPGFRQTSRDPVVCVSWEDLREYLGWINSKVCVQKQSKWCTRGGPYRALTATEWTYAARGGSEVAAPLYWGDLPSHDFANYGEEFCGPCGIRKEGRDRWMYTSPVGSFPPNQFGLFDMVGNVWTWSECVNVPGVSSAPTAVGAGATASDCQYRTVLGCSFDDMGECLGSIAIGAPDPNELGNPYPIYARNYANGFRLARDLN